MRDLNSSSVTCCSWKHSFVARDLGRNLESLIYLLFANLRVDMYSSGSPDTAIKIVLPSGCLVLSRLHSMPLNVVDFYIRLTV